MGKGVMQQEGFRQLFAAAATAMIVIDERGGVVALNPRAERLFGWTEAELIGEPWDRLIPPRFQRLAGQRPSHDEEDPVSLFARRRDGTEFPVEFNRGRLGTGPNALVLVTIRDLTGWRRAQETLFREKEQAFVTLSSIADALITTDLTGRITYLNPTAERLTGWRMTEALGQPLGTVLTLVSEVTRQPVEDIPARCLREDRAVDLGDGFVLLRRDGSEVAIGDSAAPLRDRNGATVGVVVVCHDVTERRRVVRKLTHDAAHDSLTGLISRQEFERRLRRVLAEGEAGTVHALCYLDLDRFKAVNDACGHEAGDHLLKTISDVLASRLRGRDTVARLGGDEFGVLLEGCSLDKAEEIALALQRAVRDLEFFWEGRTFPVGASVGVVPIAGARGRVADILRAADDACYAAKEAGGNRVHVARESDVDGEREDRSRRIPRVARAVEEERLRLLAQPIVPLAPGSVARPRCEILLHLADERGGVDTANSLLADAERLGLIPDIDRWVVRRTVALVSAWHREHPECELPLCSINLNVRSLDDPDLVADVGEQLAQHGLPPAAIAFEIDEAAALANFAQLVRLISEVRGLGCGFGLDDFGGGLASFVHLKALSVDYVKIGAHYVRSVAEDAVYGTLVSAVSQIGRILGIATIAEGVETEDHLNKLRDLGAEYVQGNAMAPPARLLDDEGVVVLPCVRRVG